MPGIYGEGKVVSKPDIFPLANREREYFANPDTINSITGLSRIAVKYGRLCLGVPLLKEEMETQAILNDIVVDISPRDRIQPISEEACTAIVRMLRGRTNMVDIQYCRT